METDNRKPNKKKFWILLIVDIAVLSAAVLALIFLIHHFYGNPLKKETAAESTTQTSETDDSETDDSETETVPEVSTSASESGVAEITDHTDKTSETAAETTENPTEDTTEAASEQAMEIDEELYSVKITVPPEFASDYTEERRQEDEAAEGIGAVVIHDDGSITYYVTEEKGLGMADELAEQLEEMRLGLVGSENTPQILDIQAAEDYTLFAVTTKNGEPDEGEVRAVKSFFGTAGRYHCFKGDSVDNIQVIFFNADSGKVISAYNSKDLREE